MLLKHLRPSKHKSLLAWFNQNYAKTEKIDRTLSKAYNDAFNDRQESDYTLNFIPDSEELIQALDKAKDFIEEIKKYIDKEPAW